MLDKEELLANAREPAKRAIPLQTFHKGKVQLLPTCSIRNLSVFSIWDTPGIVEPCKAISAIPSLVSEHTNKANCIAIVPYGTRVQGVWRYRTRSRPSRHGTQSPAVQIPGRARCCPSVLKHQRSGKTDRTTKSLEPSLGGMNLEDIAQPKCCRILETLRQNMTIPVWHDEQQGSATVILTGSLNALNLVGEASTAFASP